MEEINTFERAYNWYHSDQPSYIAIYLFQRDHPSYQNISFNIRNILKENTGLTTKSESIGNDIPWFWPFTCVTGLLIEFISMLFVSAMIGSLTSSASSSKSFQIIISLLYLKIWW